jgi:hypothetical protein
MSEPGWNPRRLADPGTANFVRPSDAAYPKCVEALADVIGAEAAAMPSMQRRIALDGETGELLLLLDVPVQWFSPSSGEYVVAPEPGPKLDAWLAFAPLAFPVDTAVELLQGNASPELELSRRRQVLRTRDELRAQHQAKKDAEAEAATKAKEEAEERKVRWREQSWNELGAAGQLIVALALKIEERDPTLAGELRSVALEPVRLPHCQWWLPRDQRAGE